MQYFALLLVPPLALYGVVWLIGTGAIALVNWIADLRASKRARAERELDRTAAELRATVSALAEQLNADGLEARKALIRESYLATSRARAER